MSEAFTSARLGDLADFDMGQSPSSQFVSDAPTGLPFLQGSAEFGKKFPHHKMYCRRPTKVCEVGDILVSVRAPVGDLNLADRKYCIGRGLAAIRFNRVIPTYGWHLMSYFGPRLRRVAQGTTFEAISKKDLQDLRVVVPSLSEQRRIAEILDTVDEAIRKTEEVIAKLKQVKAGLLHDLLTRGIDEHGQLRDPIAHPEQFKDSPLGRLPREWTNLALSDICLYVVDCPHTTPSYAGDGYLVARTSEIRDGSFDVQTAPTVGREEFLARTQRLEPSVGDLIITREAPVGEGFVVPAGMKVCLGQRTMALRPDPSRAYPGYLLAQLYSGTVRRRIEQMTAGTTNPHLNVGDVRAFQVPTPPMTEQRRIVDAIDAVERRIEAEQQHSDKMRSIKVGLLSDLLSGAVSALPEAASFALS